MSFYNGHVLRFHEKTAFYESEPVKLYIMGFGTVTVNPVERCPRCGGKGTMSFENHFTACAMCRNVIRSAEVDFDTLQQLADLVDRAALAYNRRESFRWDGG
ncbi:MAG: hypothetical protein JSS75_07070 [Bacteroidetes bacterium]|nr:hypothetical protein [Bacteroidota bacterium]